VFRPRTSPTIHIATVPLNEPGNRIVIDFISPQQPQIGFLSVGLRIQKLEDLPRVEICNSTKTLKVLFYFVCRLTDGAVPDVLAAYIKGNTLHLTPFHDICLKT